MKNETLIRNNENNSPTNKLKLTFSHIKKFSSDFKKDKNNLLPKDNHLSSDKPIKSKLLLF